MLGLPKGEVFLVPWTEKWEKAFTKEKQKIKDVLNFPIVAVHHIGSTAVEGLAAKPIIDIAIELENFETGKNAMKSLEEIGYTYHGTNILPERHYFTKGEPRTHQIHLYEHRNKYLLEQLGFRDYLRSNQETKMAYERLKHKLAEANASDKHRYAEAKTQFIQNVLKKH